MINVETANEFAVRYYSWSLAEGMREVEQDFPLLSTIKDPGARGYVDYLRGLDHNQANVVSALIKNANPDVLPLIGEVLTPTEQALVDNFFDEVQPLTLRYLEKFFTERYVLPNPEKKANKRRLAKSVRIRLDPICGNDVSRDSAFLWVHRTRYEEWEIHTEIDMGGNRDLSYWHSISPRGSTERLKAMIFFAGWLGLPQTEWMMLKESEEGEATESIAKMCERFMSAVPSLLHDLSPTRR